MWINRYLDTTPAGRVPVSRSSAGRGLRRTTWQSFSLCFSGNLKSCGRPKPTPPMGQLLLTCGKLQPAVIPLRPTGAVIGSAATGALPCSLEDGVAHRPESPLAAAHPNRWASCWSLGNAPRSPAAPMQCAGTAERTLHSLAAIDCDLPFMRELSAPITEHCASFVALLALPNEAEYCV